MHRDRRGYVRTWTVQSHVCRVSDMERELASGQYRGEFTRAAYGGAEVDQSLLYGFGR